MKWRLPTTEEVRAASVVGLFKLPGWQTFDGTFWLTEQHTTMWHTTNVAVSAGDRKLVELGSYAQAHAVCVAAGRATSGDPGMP